MTALVRADIGQILRRARHPHPGLLLARGWPEYVDAEGSRGKSGHVHHVCQQPVPDLYRLAYQRWRQVTVGPSRFRHLYARLEHRLFIGVSAGNTVETGVTTSHSYGMPLIPGSSVKGCAQAYAKHIGVPEEYRAVLFGEDPDSAARAEPSRVAGAGSLVWHDAWWNPDGQESPFVEEIVTTHHQAYYGGEKDEATDFDNPVPNAQVAVQGGFHFVIEGEAAWADLAIRLLTPALAEVGIGAKLAAGYGTMVLDQAATSKAKAEERARAEQYQTPRQRVESRLRAMSPEQLARHFGPELNATRSRYSDEEWGLVPEVAQTLFSDLLGAWAGETKKSNKPRFKARRFLLSLREEG